jgi:hypothetical protein
VELRESDHQDGFEVLQQSNDSPCSSDAWQDGEANVLLTPTIRGSTPIGTNNLSDREFERVVVFVRRVSRAAAGSIDLRPVGCRSFCLVQQRHLRGLRTSRAQGVQSEKAERSLASSRLASLLPCRVCFWEKQQLRCCSFLRSRRRPIRGIPPSCRRPEQVEVE